MSRGEDQALGEGDDEEEFDLPASDRRLITQAYDLSVNTLVEQWNDSTLVVPDFQRGYVWDNGKASRLVESLLLGIPIPVLYFYETPTATYEIIDGHQRIRSVARYLKNEFPLISLRLLGNFIGKRYHQLPEREQRLLRTRVIRAIIVSYESSSFMQFEIFERLNTGAMQLNSQEIRNALFPGTLNHLLMELESVPSLRSAIGTKLPRPRMVDRELGLRFLALDAYISVYKPPLLKLLNDFAKDNREALPDACAVMRDKFIRSVDRVWSLFGPGSFRLLASNGTPVERNVNRALFDAQMLVCGWVVPGFNLAAQKDEVVDRVVQLYANDAFLDAIQRATGDRARLYRRVKGFAAAFQAAGVPIAAPELPE
jgi:hypothetical protein